MGQIEKMYHHQLPCRVVIIHLQLVGATLNNVVRYENHHVTWGIEGVEPETRIDFHRFPVKPSFTHRFSYGPTNSYKFRSSSLRLYITHRIHGAGIYANIWVY